MRLSVVINKREDQITFRILSNFILNMYSIDFDIKTHTKRYINLYLHSVKL